MGQVENSECVNASQGQWPVVWLGSPGFLGLELQQVCGTKGP